MTTQSNWKGSLKLSLVSVPVKAYTSNATESGTQLSKLRTQESQDLDIQEFINQAALDPIYWSGVTYYLVPDGPVAHRPYVVLRQAMAEQKRYAIAQTVWQGNKLVVLLRPMGGLIGMTILNYDQQITRPTVFEEETPTIDVAPLELKLAKTLIEHHTARKFDFSKYGNIETSKPAELLETKVASTEISAVAAQEKIHVLDFMDALQQSVAKLEGAEPKDTKPGKKMAPSKPAPSAARKNKTS